MNNPFARASAGQPFRPSAGIWNQFIDAARQARAGKLGKGGQGVPSFEIDPANTCLFQNKTGDDLGLFVVLAYGDAIPVPTDDEALNAQQRPGFEGTAPVSADRPFVVMWDPVADDAFGRAIVSGLAVVQVDIRSTAHRRAKPSPAVTANLSSASANGVPIVWPQSFTETGVQWCVVLIDGAGGCCTEDSPPVTIALGCSTSGSGGGPGSGSGSSGGSGACEFGIDVCANDDAIYTWPIATVRLTGAAKAAALAACSGQAIFHLFGDCDNPLIGGSFSDSQCIVLFNGTRSYVDLFDPVTIPTTWDGTGYPIANTTGAVTTSGRMVLCPNAAVPGFYFDGQITSTAADFLHPDRYGCGCVANIGGCQVAANDVTQTIVAGPDLDVPSETLQIATGCGLLDMRLAPCSVPPPSPPPPPPPGDDCRVCTLVGQRALMHIPDGPFAGDYLSDGFILGDTWYSFPGGSGVGFTVPGTDNGAQAVCRGADGLVRLTSACEFDVCNCSGPGTSVQGGVTCGSPTVMTFPGAGWCSTGDITITTPPP